MNSIFRLKEEETPVRTCTSLLLAHPQILQRTTFHASSVMHSPQKGCSGGLKIWLFYSLPNELHMLVVISSNLIHVCVLFQDGPNSSLSPSAVSASFSHPARCVQKGSRVEMHLCTHKNSQPWLYYDPDLSILLSANYCIILVNITSLKIQSFPALQISLANKLLSFLHRLRARESNPEASAYLLLLLSLAKKTVNSYTLYLD